MEWRNLRHRALLEPLAWLGRIADTAAPGAIPSLANTISLLIKAMDLALILPLCVLAGVLPLRRSAPGYLLTSVGVLKFITIGLAVSLMALNQARVGVPFSPVELVVSPLITLVNPALAAALLRNVA